MKITFKLIAIIAVSSFFQVSAMNTVKDYTVKQVEAIYQKPLFFEATYRFYPKASQEHEFKFALLDKHPFKDQDPLDYCNSKLARAEAEGNTKSAFIELIRILVFEEHRNKGYGSLFLKLILDYLSTKTPFEELRLTASSDGGINEKKLYRFYRKNGGQNYLNSSWNRIFERDFIFFLKRKVISQSTETKL